MTSGPYQHAARNDQPNEKGIATMKLTTVTQVTIDGTQTTDPEAGR